MVQEWIFVLRLSRRILSCDLFCMIWLAVTEAISWSRTPIITGCLIYQVNVVTHDALTHNCQVAILVPLLIGSNQIVSRYCVGALLACSTIPSFRRRNHCADKAALYLLINKHLCLVGARNHHILIWPDLIEAWLPSPLVQSICIVYVVVANAWIWKMRHQFHGIVHFEPAIFSNLV